MELKYVWVKVEGVDDDPDPQFINLRQYAIPEWIETGEKMRVSQHHNGLMLTVVSKGAANGQGDGA